MLSFFASFSPQRTYNILCCVRFLEQICYTNESKCGVHTVRKTERQRANERDKYSNNVSKSDAVCFSTHIIIPESRNYAWNTKKMQKIWRMDSLCTDWPNWTERRSKSRLKHRENLKNVTSFPSLIPMLYVSLVPILLHSLVDCAHSIRQPFQLHKLNSHIHIQTHMRMAWDCTRNTYITLTGAYKYIPLACSSISTCGSVIMLNRKGCQLENYGKIK